MHKTDIQETIKKSDSMVINGSDLENPQSAQQKCLNYLNIICLIS